jgi:archaellum component FlaC
MINKGKPGKIYEDRKNFTIKFKGTSKEIIDISSKMEDLSREVEDIRQTIRDKCHTLMDAVNRYLRGPEDS